MKKESKAVADRKKVRRSRRIRNIIISYVVVIVLLAGLSVAGFYGFSLASEKVKELLPEEESFVTETTQEESIPEENIIEIEEPESEVIEYTKEELLEEVVDSCVGDMTLEEKVAGLFIITPEALTGVDNVLKAGDGTKEALEKYPVGGLIYFKSNIQSMEQVQEMLGNTTSYSKYPIFLAVDEELGDVARVQSALGLEKTQIPAQIGENKDASVAYDNYKIVGERLAECGFNLDFAPVADILLDENNKAIGNRSFGDDATTVADMVEASVKGLVDTGITPCLKHYPGQGAVDADTHEGIATTDRTADEIRQEELLPFIRGVEAGAQMVMVGHFTAPALEGDEALPCSLSKEVMTDLLRSEYQYDGVIVTDALAMSAISEYYASDEAAIKALKAGADMLLMPENFVEAYEGVLKAVNDGTISEQRIDDSLKRVYRIKYASTVE